MGQVGDSKGKVRKACPQLPGASFNDVSTSELTSVAQPGSGRDGGT